MSWWVRGGGSAAFSPIDLTNLFAWYRSDGPYWQNTGRTTAAVADDDPVRVWDDKSGNGRHITAPSDATRPLLKLSIVNSLPVIRFDGTDDEMSLTGISLSQPNAYGVVAAKRDTNWAPLIGGGIGTPNWNVIVINDSGFSPAEKLRMNAGTGVNGSTTVAIDTFYHITALFNGASSELWLNGSSDLTGDPGTGAPDRILLGRDQAGINPEFGRVDYADVVYVDGDFAAGERASLESYFADRYGI